MCLYGNFGVYDACFRAAGTGHRTTAEPSGGGCPAMGIGQFQCRDGFLVCPTNTPKDTSLGDQPS